jgi:hypothetical protein
MRFYFKPPLCTRGGDREGGGGGGMHLNDKLAINCGRINGH